MTVMNTAKTTLYKRDLINKNKFKCTQHLYTCIKLVPSSYTHISKYAIHTLPVCPIFPNNQIHTKVFQQAISLYHNF